MNPYSSAIVATLFTALAPFSEGALPPHQPEPSHAQTPATASTNPNPSAETVGTRLLLAELLKQASRDCPSTIPKAIEAATREIEAKFPDDEEARARARDSLCRDLLMSAPAFGLLAFEEIEEEPGRLPRESLATLRVLAGMTYATQGRPDPARRQYRLVTEMSDARQKDQGIAWFCLAQMMEQSQEQSEYLAKAVKHLKLANFDELVVLAMQLYMGDLRSARDFIDLKPRPDQRRFWAVGAIFAIPALVTEKNITQEQAATAVDQVLHIFSEPKGDVSQRTKDFISFAAATREMFPEAAMRAADEAESLAKTLPDDPKLLYVARLCRAKMLKLMGRQEDLKAYSDIDLTDHIAAGWSWDGDVLVSKATGENTKN